MVNVVVTCFFPHTAWGWVRPSRAGEPHHPALHCVVAFCWRLVLFVNARWELSWGCRDRPSKISPGHFTLVVLQWVLVYGSTSPTRAPLRPTRAALPMLSPRVACTIAVVGLHALIRCPARPPLQRVCVVVGRFLTFPPFSSKPGSNRRPSAPTMPSRCRGLARPTAATSLATACTSSGAGTASGA